MAELSKGRERTLPARLAKRLYSFNRNYSHTARLLAAMGYLSPVTGKPYSHQAIKKAIQWAEDNPEEAIEHDTNTTPAST